MAGALHWIEALVAAEGPEEPPSLEISVSGLPRSGDLKVVKKVDNHRRGGYIVRIPIRRSNNLTPDIPALATVAITHHE